MSKLTYPWAQNPVKLQQAVEAVTAKNKVDPTFEISEKNIKDNYIARAGKIAPGHTESSNEETEETKSLEDLSVPKLKKLAAKKEIDISECKNREELIAKLREAGIE